jgi:alcohol dehydrogenase
MPAGTLFQTTGRIIRGAGCLARVADEVTRLRKTKVTIVTDPGIVATGMIARLTEILRTAGIDAVVFDAIEPDPRLQIAGLAAEQLRATGCELVIGIGGGSAIDIAKVAAILVTNEGPITTFFGIDLVPRPGLPLIVIPTTAGTGSEVTPIAILSDEEEKLKKGIVSPYLFPTVALLDPELTVGLPPQVTAATGMDALIHAMEAYTSKNADPLTDLFACRAMELLSVNIRRAYGDGTDIEARSAMLEGSMLAGMAFANAGVTAVHAFAYPIGAEFHIPHGIANSMMLIPVMEFNMVARPERFARIAGLFGEDVTGCTPLEGAVRAIEAIRALVADLHLPKKLSEYGVKEKDLDNLAAGVMKVTRLLANNPRELTLADARDIYLKVL